MFFEFALCTSIYLLFVFSYAFSVFVFALCTFLYIFCILFVLSTFLYILCIYLLFILSYTCIFPIHINILYICSLYFRIYLLYLYLYFPIHIYIFFVFVSVLCTLSLIKCKTSLLQ